MIVRLDVTSENGALGLEAVTTPNEVVMVTAVVKQLSLAPPSKLHLYKTCPVTLTMIQKANDNF